MEFENVNLMGEKVRFMRGLRSHTDEFSHKDALELVNCRDLEDAAIEAFWFAFEEKRCKCGKVDVIWDPVINRFTVTGKCPR